jgi:hypothetical protein
MPIAMAITVATRPISMLFPKDPLGLAGRPLQWPFANPKVWLGTDASGRGSAGSGTPL